MTNPLCPDPLEPLALEADTPEAMYDLEVRALCRIADLMTTQTVLKVNR